MRTTRLFDVASGDDDEGAFVIRGIDQRTRRRRHDHAGDPANSHHRADQAALPAMREQKDAEERANARLEIGHEKIERFERFDDARLNAAF